MCKGLVVCVGSKVSPFQKIAEMVYSQVEGEELTVETAVLFLRGSKLLAEESQ